jgi:flavin reductase (DIM6/NTAB) family NADH-FMN oxidoreductase RutF
MAPPFVSFTFADLTPREAYSLMVEAVVPRPIAFVSSLSSAGVPNLAPFSFFMLGGSNPPSLAFSPTLNREGLGKDTLTNIEATGEYVVNSVHRAIAEDMNRTSASFPPHVSEWDHVGFTPIPSQVVKPARVAESLIQFECKLFQVVRHGSGPTSAAYIIGEVVRAHFAQELFDGDALRAGAIQLVGRLGKPGYVDIAGSEIFDMERPG